MDRIGDIAGRIWTAALIERAEEADAGRLIPGFDDDTVERVMREAARMPLIRVGTASRAARQGDRKRAGRK
jgi:hypothetical protein